MTPRRVFFAAWLLAVPPLFAFEHETTRDPGCNERDGVNCPHLGKPLFWARSSMPIPYALNPNGSGFSLAAMAAAVDRAFQSWQGAASGNLTFVDAGQTPAGKNAQDGQNVLFFGPFSGGSGSQTFAQTTVTFTLADGEIIDADTQYNSNFSFAVLPSGENDPNDPRVDLQAVATHEAGHLFGLDHENTKGFDVVMYFNDTTGNTAHRLLSQDDRDGVRAIYGGGGAGGGGGCAVGRTGDTADLTLVAAILALVALRRGRGLTVSDRGAA